MPSLVRLKRRIKQRAVRIKHIGDDVMIKYQVNLINLLHIDGYIGTYTKTNNSKN